MCNVIVWGNISGSFYIDLQKAKVFNYDGAVKGPALFSLPAQNIIPDRFVRLYNCVLDSRSKLFALFYAVPPSLHKDMDRNRISGVGM